LVTFIALFAGPTLGTAELCAISDEPSLCAEVAARMIREEAETVYDDESPPGTPGHAVRVSHLQGRQEAQTAPASPASAASLACDAYAPLLQDLVTESATR
jgi:hypothetical protein